ncbi:MAG: hypothetical protein J6U54_12440 [Clostridiales bacterium]|nr:hypothetical protein [Clostridiales bacterium]
MDSEKKYVFTERAHYMCPNMHFGIIASIKRVFYKDKIVEGLKALQEAHPFLKSVIMEEIGNGKIYYQESEIEIPFTVSENSWQFDYDRIALEGWNVKKDCLLKVYAYPRAGMFDILFVSHHLLCDGRGLLQLVDEFTDYYEKGKKPDRVEEKLISGLSDLPPKSDLSFTSKSVIKSANKKWRKEGKIVSYDDYLLFEKSYNKAHTFNRKTVEVQGGELDKIVKTCKDSGVSVNDYLIAKMMIEEKTNKVIIAEDIRNKIKNYNKGAMGNYATAFSVVVKKKSNDIVAVSKQVSAVIKKIISNPQQEMLVLACYINMNPDLLDAVPISTLGNFSSNAGLFVGSKMFGYEKREGHCITNLGKIENSIITKATFIPPASPANKKAWGVLTVNDNMSICELTSKG